MTYACCLSVGVEGCGRERDRKEEEGKVPKVVASFGLMKGKGIELRSKG